MKEMELRGVVEQASCLLFRGFDEARAAITDNPASPDGLRRDIFCIALWVMQKMKNATGLPVALCL